MDTDLGTQIRSLSADLENAMDGGLQNYPSIRQKVTDFFKANEDKPFKEGSAKDYADLHYRYAVAGQMEYSKSNSPLHLEESINVLRLLNKFYPKHYDARLNLTEVLFYEKKDYQWAREFADALVTELKPMSTTGTSGISQIYQAAKVLAIGCEVILENKLSRDSIDFLRVIPTSNREYNLSQEILTRYAD